MWADKGRVGGGTQPHLLKGIEQYWDVKLSSIPQYQGCSSFILQNSRWTEWKDAEAEVVWWWLWKALDDTKPVDGRPMFVEVTGGMYTRKFLGPG